MLAHSLGAVAACLHRTAGRTDTDCLADPATSAIRTTVAARLVQAIPAGCAGGAFLVPGGDCAGVRTPAALADCVGGGHDADAVVLSRVLGGAGGASSTAGRMCQSSASRALRTYARARLRILQRCKGSPPPDLTPGATCASVVDLSARRNTAAAGIATHCGALAIADARFGAPCTTSADGATLAACLLAAADGVVDDALDAEFPDTGFCGDAGPAIDARITTLLGHMTLAEKIDQMHGAVLTGVSYTAPNPSRGIPGLVMVDGARGLGTVVGHATAFPVAMARGATWDPALEEQVGDAMGIEARAKGVSVLLAPTINILRHPRWGRAQETYGEDTVHLGRMAVGFINGVQRHVITSAKHFAGNSIENTRFNVDVSVDERALREVYLPHFRMAVQRGHTGSVMSAYNKVNGHYCGENDHLLGDVLKGDWGFQGFVESDWVLGTHATVPSITAGLDIEMPIAIYYGQLLTDAVAASQVTLGQINTAVRRSLRAQFCFRLDTDPPQADPLQIETPEHTSLTRSVARESIVLLKNASGTLPLVRSQLHSLVVVGALASAANIGDHGSSAVSPSYVVTALDGITAAAGAITVTSLAAAPSTPAEQATVAAADAALVVVGLSSADEGEGFITIGDRQSLVLPGGQDALIAAVAALNPRTIVVLEGSGAVTMPWLDDVSAVLTAWYPGQEGGNAIADVLFGDAVPSGRLPVTFPRAEGDLPPFDNTSLAVTYGSYHGYRYLDRNGVAPLFPFGFGLSYTTFQYANLTVSPAGVGPYGRVHVTADVTNTGTVAGDEVVQLYVGYEGSSVDRAVNDLKDFARVHLEPGETQTVAFDLHAADLAFWDTGVGDWVVEPITYDVRVGPSSRDLPLQGVFAVVP